MERGEKFIVNCTSCGVNQEKHVNDIQAKQNSLIVLGGIGLGIIVTIALWNILGAIGTISATIPLLIWNQQSNSAHTFNSYRSRRT